MAAIKESLRRRAMAAAAALLGAVSRSHAAPPAPATAEPPIETGPWTWDASFLQYSESERIYVSEPQLGVRRDFTEGRALSVLATVDTISGATPLGTLPLTPATVPDTITGPSGTRTNPDIGKVPTSPMTDTRLALTTSYMGPVGAAANHVLAATISKEHDYLSAGTSYTWNRDLNRKNTTLSLGVSPEYDVVQPNGGLPFAYATTQTPGEFEGRNKSKYLVSGLVGITQVISRRTLMQWNYAPTYENGYLNDPYKLLSLVNANGDPLSAIHEKRPGSRMQHSLYWLMRHAMNDADVFNLSLRYFTDTWGIHSQTIDFTYRWQYHERRFLEPHVRYYHQTAADFYRAGLLGAQPLPDFASADYRLTDIDGTTFGVRFGWTMRNGSELILRGEYYIQTGEDKPRSAVGVQKQYDLFPTLHATILQVEYKFEPRQLWAKK